jgi:hypothetical protein
MIVATYYRRDLLHDPVLRAAAALMLRSPFGVMQSHVEAIYIVQGYNRNVLTH